MTILVRQNLVATSKYSLKCPYSMDAQYITVHNTYNDASADAEVHYMIGNGNSTSFHYAVDDKEVVNGIPVNRNAWHSGDGNKDGNRKSIGVEICYSKSGGERYRKAEALAIKFIAQLLKERGWGVDRVRKHQDWNGKYCPHRILDEGRWALFVSAVAAELACLCAGTKVSAPVTTPPSAPAPSAGGIQGIVRVLATNLNIRAGAGTNYASLGKAPTGKEYGLLSNVNDWHEVQLDDGRKGFLFGNNGEYLKLLRVRVKATNLNIRAGRGTNYASLGKALQGAVYVLISNVDDWHEVILPDGSRGFLFGNNGEYLELL